MIQNQNVSGVFLYHCFSKGNQLSLEKCPCLFHFILHLVPDKAAFVSGALLCEQLLPRAGTMH